MEVAVAAGTTRHAMTLTQVIVKIPAVDELEGFIVAGSPSSGIGRAAY